MSYTLGQAARAVGKSKPTIARAIQTGRLSASRTDLGTFVIDPAELHRVFQVAGNGAGTMKQTVPGEPDGTSQVERDRLLIEHEDLRETIRDLRQRLDAESEERRRGTGAADGAVDAPACRQRAGGQQPDLDGTTSSVVAAVVPVIHY